MTCHARCSRNLPRQGSWRCWRARGGHRTRLFRSLLAVVSGALHFLDRTATAPKSREFLHAGKLGIERGAPPSTTASSWSSFPWDRRGGRVSPSESTTMAWECRLTCARASLRALIPGIPVLMITGSADRHRMAGEEVLAKPFSQAGFAQRLLTVLGRREGREANLRGRIKNPGQRDLLDTWTALRRPRLPSVAALHTRTRSPSTASGRELSGCGARPARDVHFFAHVAPCMDTPVFQGRIAAALAARDGGV